MKLKLINKLLLPMFAAFILGSCNDDSDNVTSIDYSADAQIYSFKLTAKPDNAIDTLNYPVLAKTLFSIDQLNRVIFNRDSLPYQTRLKKYSVAITYSSASPSKVELVYPDTVMEWNGTDSVDFATHLYPVFKVTAQSGYSLEYTIDLKIRKVDPDLINWSKNTTSLPSTVRDQKTVMTNDGFYTYSIDNDNQLYLRKTDEKVSSYEPKQGINGITASDILLESITYFKGELYALDKFNNAYNSSNGTDWYQKSANVKAILGVLPSSSEDKDVLLLLTENAGKYSLAKTMDMITVTPIRELTSFELNSFPLSGFSSTVNYDRNNLNKNILAITGGLKSDNNYSNLTWLIQTNSNGELRINSNQQHNRFQAKEGIVSFMYNDYLYVLTNNKFYKSNFADSWLLAPDKEQFEESMTSMHGQSVLIDNKNNIWIFGGIPDSGTTPFLEIWKGRINKLNVAD